MKAGPFAAILVVLVLSGCAAYDPIAMTDFSVIDRPAMAYLVKSVPDLSPGAGGPGGTGAGASWRR